MMTKGKLYVNKFKNRGVRMPKWWWWYNLHKV